jgi:predicted Zn-dependent protease
MRMSGVPANALTSQSDAESLVARIVKQSKADAVHVNLTSAYTTNLRFAANQMSTSGAVTDAQLAVTSAFGGKHAVATTNDLSDASIARVIATSEALAKLAPDDPESMPELGKQTYTPVTAYFDATANVSPDDRAKAALSALAPARSAGDVNAAGFLIVNASATVVGNSAGLFAYHRSTNANYTITVRTADGTGSGWAGAEHPDWTQIDFAATSHHALEKAKASQNPKAIEPGRYTVIFEPQAVGDLVQLIGNYTDARSADEGRSPFTKQGGGNKVGQKIVDTRVTLFSDPRDDQLLDTPFDNEGMPLGRQVWIDNGVLQQLQYTRYWAQKSKQQATGNPGSIKLQGTGPTQSIDEMIANTQRGVLVTRLWYLREVDPRTILYTGLTRDGTFLIENGKISTAVRNMRFNDSPLFMLANLDAMGQPVRVAGTEAGGAVVMPPIKVHDFNFTSLSEAV